jgi:hypothetical protein
MTNEKTYIIMDAQNPVDNWGVTLDEAKSFLGGHFEEDDFETEEEYNQYHERLENADYSELQLMLTGIDYRLFENEEERLEWVRELF